jgi:hypothetical protein
MDRYDRRGTHCFNHGSYQSTSFTESSLAKAKVNSCFRFGYLDFLLQRRRRLSSIARVSSLTAPLTAINMASKRLLDISQTPLILALGLAQRHEEVLLARLLLVGRALALGLLLQLALGRR